MGRTSGAYGPDAFRKPATSKMLRADQSRSAMGWERQGRSWIVGQTRPRPLGTLTRPPPAEPVTSVAASSCYAPINWACICAACCVNACMSGTHLGITPEATARRTGQDQRQRCSKSADVARTSRPGSVSE